MLESLVEKLLNKFLAPYVEGIEKNLHLGVWSGNIVLENLNLKPQITEILDLSFKIVHGSIGQINIQIPWSSLGKNPVCVFIKNAHIYVKPRHYKKSESVIIEELRRAKMHRLEMLEEEISLIKQQKNKEKPAEKSTLIFKLLNKIINNIQIDIQDVFIHFEDIERNFFIGFILKSSSVKNLKKKDERSSEGNSDSESKKLNHIIEFKGLCIYSNSSVNNKKRGDKKSKKKGKKENAVKKKNSKDITHETDMVNNNLTNDYSKKEICSDTENKINDNNSKEENVGSTSPMSIDDKKLSKQYSKDNIDSKFKFSSEHFDNDEENDYLKKTLANINLFYKSDEHKLLDHNNFEYLIKPFDLVLPVEQSSNKKELKARLEISDKWEGITLTRTQITKIIEIMSEANNSRNEINKLLLKHASTVKLDVESLRNETKNEFMNLYNKILGEEYNISKIELTKKEQNRLQILYDVVGVRHLAKWRLQCRDTLEKIIEEKNCKKKILYDSIYKQQSWWSWVTGNKKDIENKVQSILKTEQDFINEHELNILQEAVVNEDNYDVVIPTKYDFEFKLSNFSINIYDDRKKRKYIINKGIHSKNYGKFNEQEQECIKEASNKNNETYNENTHKNSDYNNSSNNLNSELCLSGTSESSLSTSSNISSPNSIYQNKNKLDYNEINILSINFYQIYSSLSLQSVVDHNDNDNFQWKFIIELQNFVAKHKNQIFMEFRNTQNAFSYNMDNSENIYQNPIYHSLLYSQSLCAYLEINHLVTEKGNTLSTLLRLNPLELYLSPLLINNILSFTFPLMDIINNKDITSTRRHKDKPESTQLDKGEVGEAKETTEINEVVEDTENDEDNEEALLHIKKMEQSELIEGLKEKGENVYNRAVQHLPELFEFYIHICGPILYFDNLTNGIVNLHLGNLIAKTEYPCAYNKFNLIFEFNETQITCLKTSNFNHNKLEWHRRKPRDSSKNTYSCTEGSMTEIKGLNDSRVFDRDADNINGGEKEDDGLEKNFCNNIKDKYIEDEKFYILQPIPVKVYVEYDLKILKTNIILDGIFFQINPDAVSIILAVPTSITRYLTRFYSKNKKEDESLKNKRKSNAEKKDIDGKEDENVETNPQNECENDKIKNNDVSTNLMDDNIKKEETGLEVSNIDKNNRIEEESFLYDIDFLIKTSSFSIKNSKNCDILKYEACGISYKNYFQRKKKIIKVEIEQLWICDPSNKQPIFFTLAKNINSKDAYPFKYISEYLKEEKYNSLNNMNTNDMTKTSNSSKILNESNFGTSEKYEHDDNNNNTGCLERFQSAQRLEEFMLSNSKLNENAESNSNEMNDNNKNENVSKNSYPSLYKETVDVDKFDLLNNEEVENFDNYENDKYINKEIKKQSSGKVEDNDDDDFMDAIEEKQLSINLQIMQKHNENNIAQIHVDFIVSDIELHWKYKTIKQIFKTMKEYKNILQYGIEKDMKYIKNKLKNEKELKNYKMLISEHTLRSVQETLKNVKNSLNILDIKASTETGNNQNNINENDTAEKNETVNQGSLQKDQQFEGFSDENNKILRDGDVFNKYNNKEKNNVENENSDVILKNGLNGTLPKLFGEENSYVKYFFNCYVKSASLSFWEKKKIFSKIQVSNIFYENNIYLNFDQKMFINIEKGIISLNGKNIISNNINDYTYDLFISKKRKEYIDGSEYIENNINNVESSNQNILNQNSKDNRNYSDDEDRTLNDRKNSKDIFNYITVANLSDEIKKRKETMTPNKKKQFLFVGNVNVYNDKRYYNTCMMCDISGIYYIFYLRDLRLFLEYLDDGILNVFISKSYKKVVQVAQEKYFLFQFTIVDPIVIIPEDKNIIYNYKGQVKDTSKYDKDTKNSENNNRSNNNTDLNNEKNGNRGNNNKSIPYIESYLKFHLSTLKFKNAYTKNCAEEIVLRQRNEIKQKRMRKEKRRTKYKLKKKKVIKKNINDQKVISKGDNENDGDALSNGEGRNSTDSKHKKNKHVKIKEDKGNYDLILGSKGLNNEMDNSQGNNNINMFDSNKKYDFTLYVDLLDIESMACENGGSKNIEGNILHKIDIGLCLLSRKDGIFIFFNGKDLCLDLTVYQLRFLLDIINENFCYKGYFPMCFICDKNIDIDNMLDAELFRKGNIALNNLKNKDVSINNNHIKNDEEIDQKKHNMPNKNDKMSEDNITHGLNDTSGNNSNYNTEENDNNEMKNNNSIIKDTNKTDGIRKNGTKFYAYINLESLKIKTSFDNNIPVAIITFQNISISFDITLLDFYYIYFFNLYSTSLYIDDVRNGSVNYYKRVAYCCIENEMNKKRGNRDSKYGGNVRFRENESDFVSPTSGASRDQNSHNNSNNNKINSSYTYAIESGGSVNGQGNRMASNDASQNFDERYEINNYKSLLNYMFDNNVFLNERKKNIKQKGIKIKINSFIEDLLLSIELDDAYICCFFVIFIDIYKFLSTGFNLSTLHLYPKPSPYIVSNKYYNNKNNSINNNINDGIEKHKPVNEEKSGSSQLPEKKKRPKNEKKEDTDAPKILNKENYIKELIKDDKNQKITNINELLKMDNKPIHIDFKVNNGNFILFTNLENVDHPIIMWSNNFVFSFSLSNGCILFRKIYAIDSKIKRLNYVNNSIRLSRSMISNYSGIFNNNNKMDSINVSNPLHNYHKKKILLCENLNVIGEAIYESVDTKKDNYIIKKNIRKKDHPQFISVFEIDLNISNFDIRLSNDDVEILLKASSTLFGDVPSAYTNIAISAVTPPVTFIHRKIKSIFMRNNIFFISKGMEGNHDTINGLEITNLNRIRKIDKAGKKQRDRIRNNSIVPGNEKNELKVKGETIEDFEHFDRIKNLSNVKDKRELILSESSYNNNNMVEKSAYNGEYDSSADSNSGDSNLWYFESNNSDALCSKISTQENELELNTNAAKTNAYKDVKINIKLNNVKCTFINDVKNAIVPIIRMTFSMDIKLRFYTDECSYIMNCLNSNIEYFNNCIGEWEPFLEKCNISLDVHKVLPSDIYSEDIESIRTPISIIKINSAKALWFNITPQLVNLLFMFVPVFWEKVLNGLKSKREANSINQEHMKEQQNESIMENNEIESSKKGNDDKSTHDRVLERLLYNQDDKNSVSMSVPTSTNTDDNSVMNNKREDRKSKSIYEDSSSIFDVIPDGADENKSMDFHLDSFLKKEENGEAIDPIEDNSIIYYVNLTSDYYYAFTMPERNSDDMKDNRGRAMMIRRGSEMNMQQDTVRSDNNNKKRESLDTYKGNNRDNYDKMSVDFANSEKGRVKYRYYNSIENEDIDITRYLPDVYTKIITTNELIALDELLVNEIGNNTLIEKKDLYLYLIPIPPTNIVNTLHEMFGNISKRDIVLDLMITKNPKKTIENLLSYNNLRSNSANNILIENRGKLSEGLDFKDYKIKGAYYTDNSSIISGEKKNKDDISTVSDKLNKVNKSVSYLDDTASNVPTYEKDEADLTKGESHSSCLGDDSSLKEKHDKCIEEGDENSESGNLYSDSELYEEEYYSEISNDNGDSEWDSVDEYDGYDNNTINIIEKVNKNKNIYYYFNKKNINNIKRKLYSNSVFPASKFMGPFLKNSECVMINLIKNSCTSLNTALKNNNVIHVINPSDYVFNEIGASNDSFGNMNNSNNISSMKKKYNEKNKMENNKKDNNNYEAILNREDINQESKLEQLNEEINKQTNLIYKYRPKNNCLPQKSMFETICEIISPMPNYKILFMSSTVRIINKCGIPLEFSFFDTSKSPILLTSLKNRTIDSSILYPNHSDSFKNYKVSNSLNINPNIKIIQKNTNLSYTVILNHEYLLSPPECAFNGQSQVYLSFKPVNLVSDENKYYYISNGANIRDTSNSMEKYNIGDTNENTKRNSCTISNGGSNNDEDVSLSNFEKWGNELFDCSYINMDNGWSDIFSSDISQGTYVKKCKVVDNRNLNELTGVATSSISSGSSNNSYLYFLVKIEHKISALPAEKNIRIITIYPHVSIVNTIPALVDIVMMSESTEEAQNNFINEEKIRIEMLKNKKVKLLRQSKEISSYLNKISHMKQNNSLNSNTSKALEAKRMSNNERVYVHEYNRLEKEIGNIDHEIKVLKKDLAARALNNGYVNKRLNPFSIFYIYEIKKYTCLNLKMKIGNSQCEWSDRIHLDEDDDETMTRLTLNFKKFASIEVEIIKNFNGYFNSLNSILGNKHLYIFSLPRCFIDRTGLGIKAINSNKYYPVINGITLLGDNSQIDLLLPHKTYNNNIDGVNNNGKKKTQRNNFDDIFNDFNYPVPCDNSLILFKANLPPIGSYTEANVVCNNFYYTFCLNTEKIKTTNIPYIISRIITVVPQFIISNKLHYPLLIKQFQLDQIQGVRENDTSPLYFIKKHNVLLFQFKTFEMGKQNISKNSIENNTYSRNRTGSCDNNKNEMNIMNKSRKYSKNMFWSSVIFPSENFVGSNYMVLNNGGEKDESDVYVITCIPNMGTKNIIIEKLEKKINKGYIAYNNSSLVKYLKIRTFHDDAHNLKMGKNGSNDGTNKHLDKNLLLNHFLKASDMEHYFNVEYNKYSYLGWVNPFIYISRNIQIEIVLHDMNVIPRSPLVLKFASFNYSQKTYHINYFNITFIISIEYIEDLISIKLTHRINSPNGPCDINEMNNMGKHLKKNSIGIEINADRNVVDGKDKDEDDEKKYSTNSSEMKSYNKIESIDKYEIMNDNIGTRGMANAAKNSKMHRDIPSSYNKNRYIEKKVIEQNEYNYVMNISERGRSRYSAENNNSIYSNRKESIKVINNTYKNVHVILNLTQIGASIISNILKEEVFFIELSKLCALFYMKNEEEVIDIKITDVQVDCQLESCKKCVLLANRGLNSESSSGMNNNGIISNSGRGDRGGLYKLRNGSTTYNEENERDEAYDEDGNRYGSNNDVFSKNINNNDEKTFLNVYVERLFISHNDVIFKKIQVLLDDIEIEMDSETLNGINLLVAEYIEGINIIQKKNLLYEEIQKWTVLPVYVNYKSPDIPLAINIQYMQINKFTLIVWCSFLLDKMHMLSDLLRIGLRILMVSGKLELLGAPVTLNQEIFNDIRVSIKSFYALLKDKYSHSILACLGFIVGYSSLINIPKIPLEIGRNTIGLAVYAVDNVSVGIGSLLSNLTFDTEYINRRQKERNFKTNTNMKEGLLSAVKNIGEGVLSLSNIVTKPIEGAQKEGVGGFFKGIGKGVAGSLVKPLDKVGQAVSDVTRGIKAEVSKPIGGYKYKTKRHRKPRMLWGEYGKIKEYNTQEAELRECLGLRFSENIMKCLTIHKQQNDPPSHYALLLYPKVIIYANLYANIYPNSFSNSKNNNDFTSDKKGDIVIWSVKIDEISEIRASSHGLIIRTTNGTVNSVYKIPCNNASLINKIYRELHNSKNSIKSTIILGDSILSLRSPL